MFLPLTSSSRPRLPLLLPATSLAPARQPHPHQQPRKRPAWTRAQEDRHPLLSLLLPSFMSMEPPAGEQASSTPSHDISCSRSPVPSTPTAKKKKKATRTRAQDD